MLSFQRRMRPEFADFVRIIYPIGYEDHQSIKYREPIKGFLSNIFFLNHKHLETSEEGSSSK